MDEKDLVHEMPSGQATDPEIPSQEPVAQIGEEEE